MSKSKFNVGDRVKVYCGKLRLTGDAGTVTGDCGHSGLIFVRLDKGTAECDTPLVSEKQCRRIKKKQPRYFFVEQDEFQVSCYLRDVKENSLPCLAGHYVKDMGTKKPKGLA